MIYPIYQVKLRAFQTIIEFKILKLIFFNHSLKCLFLFEFFYKVLFLIRKKMVRYQLIYFFLVLSSIFNQITIIL